VSKITLKVLSVEKVIYKLKHKIELEKDTKDYNEKIKIFTDTLCFINHVCKH